MRITRRGRKVIRLMALVIIFLGMVPLAVPAITEFAFSRSAEQAVHRVESTYDALGDDDRRELLAQARAYNARKAGVSEVLDTSVVGEIWDYDQQLAWEAEPGTMMSWVEIPKLGLRLPIYHHYDEAVLSAGVGHLDWTALPVGGEGTRCVLSAHTGLDRARLFDDIGLLEEGDLMVLWTLGEPYAYRVTGSEVVLPSQVDRLDPIPKEDLCTLVTCTPYGVNSHRLLITGERCAYEEAEAKQQEPMVPHPSRRTTPFLVALAVLAVLAIVLLCRRSRSSRPTV